MQDLVLVFLSSRWLVKALAMDKLVSCTKKGGLICFSFGVSHFEPLGFKAKVDQLIESGKWKQIGFEENDVRYLESMKIPGHYAVYQVI